MLRRLAGRSALVVSEALAGCVPYEPEDVSTEAFAPALPRQVGLLTFELAIALAVASNGEIKVREAECRAAGLEIRPTELQVQIQQDSLAPMMDALALIGMSP